MTINRIGKFDGSKGLIGVSNGVRPTLKGTRPAAPTAAEEGEGGFRPNTGQEIGNFDAIDMSSVVYVNEPVSGLRIRDINASNIYRLIDVSDKRSLTNTTISRVKLRGSERGFIRIRGPSKQIRISDCFGDGMDMWGDPFAIGVHIESGEDITIERTTMRRFSAPPVKKGYRNGDCYATEGAAKRISFIDTVAQGATDGGYDCKHSLGLVRNAVARDCSIGWREWNARLGEIESLVIEDCYYAMSFHKQGQQVHVGKLTVRSSKEMGALFKMQAGQAKVVIHDHDIQVPPATKEARVESSGNSIVWVKGRPAGLI